VNGASVSSVRVESDVVKLVAPVVFSAEPVVIRECEEALDAPLHEAANALRRLAEAADMTLAVRAMYKAVGLDPTKNRPSSEALLRRVRKGGELPRINNLVDVINWCSVESQLPFGLYDLGHIDGDIALRLGRDGESYAGIRKDEVHLAGRLVLADDRGPFGNPTSDSARTMVTTGTTRALVVIFAPVGIEVSVVQATETLTRERIGRYCS
jgi:DNA/RNA-binding domain of Phe-tRNA-synthetase-like protein